MKKEVAVLFGGQSAEHDISCKSAMNVINGLNQEKYNIHRIGITRDGTWIYVEDDISIADGTWRSGTRMAVISPDHMTSGLLICEGSSCKAQKIDVVFPILHGQYGEDGTVQGLLELSGIPYVGSGVLSSSISIDKISTKIFVDRLNIRQAKYVTDICPGTQEIERTMDLVEKELGYPVFVKPSNAGSSQGVSKAKNRAELKEAIVLAKKHDLRVLIEEAIAGREFECAILGGEDPKPSKIGEILATAEFYDFDAKYNNEESCTVIDPDLPTAVKEEIRQAAVKIFCAVSGFGLSRVDFFVENATNEIVFNEINTMPGFTNISMYPMLWEDMGYSKESLMDELIELAFHR